MRARRPITRSKFQVFGRKCHNPSLSAFDMMVGSFAILLALLITNSSTSNAALFSSPEPEMDPFGAPTLYVVSAGQDMIRKRIGSISLYNGAHVCPSNYPAGFSIRCDATSGSGRANFFVNGSLRKIEMRPPFYISGNYGNVVKAWSGYPSQASLRCKMDSGSETAVRVSFAC